MRTRSIVAFAALMLSVPALSGAADYTLKLGHANDPDPENSIFHAFALKVEELVEKYSDDAIDVEIYPAGQLGSEQEQIQGTQLGVQEAALVSMNNLNALAPNLGFFTLPYLFTSVEQGRCMIDTAWSEINDFSIDNADVRMLSITDAGFRVLTNSVRPVESLEDLQGLKIRVPQNPIMIAAFESWGSSPTPMAWSEVYSALQQGVVDGQENPVNVLLAVKFHEVQDYVTDIDYVLQTGALVLSEQFYQQLPGDLQDAVTKAGQEAMEWERSYVEEIMEEDKRRLEQDHGIVFSGRPDDFDEWVERARTIWPDQYEYIGNGDAQRGEAIVNEMVGFAEACTN